MATKSLNVIASGAKSATLTAGAIVRKTMELARLESGDLVLSFRGSEGKGTGAQLCKVADAQPLLNIMKDYAQNGAPSEDEGAVPADVMFSRTFHVHDDGTVTFRLGNGKGAKPIKLGSIAELPGFIAGFQERTTDFMRIALDNVDGDSDDGIHAQTWIDINANNG
jgi:hypothetical protein